MAFPTVTTCSRSAALIAKHSSFSAMARVKKTKLGRRETRHRRSRLSCQCKLRHSLKSAPVKRQEWSEGNVCCSKALLEKMIT
eukprot:m.32477 g.32477  ORF g.32477 m.32477 type:complete len:83 (+) comp12154_c0_seq1:1420-1668(+)